jgi:hypothetical protein
VLWEGSRSQGSPESFPLKKMVFRRGFGFVKFLLKVLNFHQRWSANSVNKDTELQKSRQIHLYVLILQERIAPNFLVNILILHSGVFTVRVSFVMLKLRA